MPGENADNYDFTSGLPVQLLKILALKLMPLLDAEGNSSPYVLACRG
ncbi:hypothetical protein [Hydrogenophaga sp.]|nr:hypothetical protein [Hydrogenophaga sp.]